MFRFDPILLPFAISTLITLVLAWTAWQRRGRTPARYFTFFLLGPIIWLVGFILEIASLDLNTKIILANIQFAGINVIPIALLALTLAYTGQIERYKYRVWALLAFPVVDQVVIWTNSWHHLFRHNAYLDTTSASFSILVSDYGPWYYFVEAPIGYLLSIFCLVYMVKTFRKAVGSYRNQSAILLIGAFFPLIVDFFYIAGFSPVPNFNLTPIAFSLSGLIYFWSLKHYRFLDVMPVARGKLIETLRDPWFVLDLSGRLVDMNQEAGELVAVRPLDLLGQRDEQALAKFPELLDYLKEVSPNYTPTEISLVKDNVRLYYEVRVFPLRNRWEKLTGRLLLLQDITRRKQLEDEREQAQLDLRESQELFSKFMKNLPVPAFIQDQQHKTLLVNAAFEHMFGPGWNNLLSGQPDTQLSDQPDSQLHPQLLKQDIARLLFQPSSEHLSEEPQLSEQQIRDAHGRRRIVEVSRFLIPRQGKPGLLGGFVHDISELKSIQKRLEIKSSEMERLANVDSLTGLYNRRFFDKALAHAASMAAYSGEPLAIGMLDIDHFKQINDSFGHARGDEVIKEIANRIIGGVRSEDTVGRIGGEEFVVLFPHTQLEDAWSVLERLRGCLEDSPIEPSLRVTISGGVTVWRPGEPTDEALARADKLLYQAKQNGRNKIIRDGLILAA